MVTASTTFLEDVIERVRLHQPQIARGWFSELKLVSMDGGVVHVRARNVAQSSYLQRHCREAFSQAAQATTGRLVSIVFVEADSKELAQASVDRSFDVLVGKERLNSDYTFEQFITGPCNRLAHAAALAVVEEPGRTYNPLFIHSPKGLGKTHLLQAICHAVRERQAETVCCFVSCETFINNFIEAAERGESDQFRDEYRRVEVLAIDDIQYLAERQRSQEEFFHVFNALHLSERQIILSADCRPAEIPNLEERLSSRFGSGLVALMDRPCLETRMAIVRKKANHHCIEVTDEVVRLVASRINTDIRALNDALLRIDALSQSRSGLITPAIAGEAIGGEVGTGDGESNCGRTEGV